MKAACLIIAGVLILALLCENIRELHTFAVTNYRVQIPGMESGEHMRAVYLSDLHNCSYGKDNERLLAAIREADPDVVLVGGDMLIGARGASYETAKCLMVALAAKYPIYYANGNHEQRMKEDPGHYGSTYRDYKAILEKAGIVFLENTSVQLKWAGADIRLSGLEIPHRYYKKFTREQLKTAEIEERIGKADPSRYQILLAHNPIHVAAYREWGADLVLCGHLHGGMVRLPWIGGVITPQVSFFPRYSGGYYREEGLTCIVSRGIGNHSINIRLFNPAEIVVIDCAS